MPKFPRPIIVCHLFGAPAAGRTQASSVNEPPILKSGVESVDTAPGILIGETGAVVGYAVADGVVPANVAEPLVPPNGEPALPLKVTKAPTMLVRDVPDASVTVVEPDGLLNRYHSVGASAVTEAP